MVVIILFTATNIPERSQKYLQNKFPNHTFVFCTKKSEIDEHIQKAEIIVTYGNDLTENKLRKADKLKWIMVMSAGVDELPFHEIKQRDILVTNARGIHKIPMAEYVISMLLSVYRQEKAIYDNQKNTFWDRSVQMKEITGQTMLVLGTGAIGQEVARLAKAFRMKTIGVSRSGQDVQNFDDVFTIHELNHILSEADFIVSVLPSTEETKGLITFRHFQLMKQEAVFLNMGRGDLVSGEDILQAIQQEEIAHVILDVFEDEPLPKDHPLWKEDRITITPHLSGISPQYLSRALKIFEHNLHAYIEGSGTYKNKIDIERGY